MAAQLVTFDLDKTLFDEVGHHHYRSEEAVRTGTLRNTAACDRVRALLQAGVPVAFITRRAASTLRGITLVQLRSWVDVEIRDDQLHQPSEWRGYAHGLEWTVAKLQELGSQVHVGDHEVLDRRAAAMAGVAFLHADDWRQGAPLPQALPDKPDALEVLA